MDEYTVVLEEKVKDEDSESKILVIERKKVKIRSNRLPRAEEVLTFNFNQKDSSDEDRTVEHYRVYGFGSEYVQEQENLDVFTFVEDIVYARKIERLRD